MYASDYINAKAGAFNIIFRQLQYLNAVDYSQSLGIKALFGGHAYVEYRIKAHPSMYYAYRSDREGGRTGLATRKLPFQKFSVMHFY